MTGDYYSHRCACGKPKAPGTDGCTGCFITALLGFGTVRHHLVTPRSHIPVILSPEGRDVELVDTEEGTREIDEALEAALEGKERS